MKDTIKIKKALQGVGIAPHMKGYYYLTDAIRIVKETTEKGEIFGGYTALYTIIGNEYKTSAGAVERAMRHAINAALANYTALYAELFGAIRSKTTPCNACFISVLAEYIIFTSEEEKCEL